MHLFWHRPKEPLRILLQTPVRGWRNGYFVLAGPVKVASHFSTYSTYLIKPLIYDVLFSKSQWFLFAFSCLLVCVFPSFHFFNSNTLVVRWSWSTQFSNGFASLKVTKDQRNVIIYIYIDKCTLDLWWDYVWGIFHGSFCSCTCCLPTFWVWGWRTASVKEETEGGIGPENPNTIERRRTRHWKPLLGLSENWVPYSHLPSGNLT